MNISFDERLLRLKKFYYQNDRFPTYQECLAIFSLKSKAGVNNFFLNGEKMKLWIKENKNWTPCDKFFEREVIDSVKAGPSNILKDFSKTVVRFEKYLQADPTRTYIMRVKGDSMKDINILEGDLVVIDRHVEPLTGDTVIATHMEYGTMIKKLIKIRGNYFLHSENKRYSDIEIDEDTLINGVVIGIVRKL